MSDVEVSSVVAAPQPEVWDRIASFAGVNYELGPWLRMTAPADVDSIEPDQVPLGRKWFRSWVLLLGVIPVDYDDLVVIEIDSGAGFLERSSMLTMRVWQHDRRLNPEGEGTRVTDRLTFTPRTLVPHALARVVIRFLFRHRHRRLRAWFSA
jgi:ligand-binding SRPBCC domain-containing protein